MVPGFNSILQIVLMKKALKNFSKSNFDTYSIYSTSRT